MMDCCIGAHINHLPLSSNAARDNCLLNDGGGRTRTNDLHFISALPFVAPYGTAGPLNPSIDLKTATQSVEQPRRIRGLADATAPNWAPS